MFIKLPTCNHPQEFPKKGSVFIFGMSTVNTSLLALPDRINVTVFAARHCVKVSAFFFAPTHFNTFGAKTKPVSYRVTCRGCQSVWQRRARLGFVCSPICNEIPFSSRDTWWLNKLSEWQRQETMWSETIKDTWRSSLRHRRYRNCKIKCVSGLCVIYSTFLGDTAAAQNVGCMRF